MKAKILSIWKSRRNRYVIIGAAAAIICVFSLIGAYHTAAPVSPPAADSSGGTQEEPQEEPVTEPEPAPETLTPEQLIFANDLAGFSSRIDGSTATIPLTEAIYGFYEQSENVPVHNTTSYAYQSLIDREKDLIFVTYPSEEEFENAKEAGIEFEIVPVTKDALVFLVNSENPVENITTAQLRDIYSGKIKNWSKVGGLDENIIPYQRTPNSGSQTLMLKLLMEGQTPMVPPEEYIAEQMGDLVTAVSSYDNSRAALGYSMFYYVNNMYGNNRFKLLAVDGVKPGRDTIMNDEYPMGTGYYAVIRKDEGENSFARKLIDWLLTDEGQSVAIKAGYIPVRPVANVAPDTEIDPIYLGDYQNSSGTGGTVWKGWEARGELETNGVKKPLSDVFYNGFNYIDFINTQITNELQALDLYHTRYMNSDTFDVVLKRAFPGIPNDYPNYSFSENESELIIEFPEDNPYFYQRGLSIMLTKDISPYGDSFGVTNSFQDAGQIIPGVDMAKPVFSMQGAPAIADKINTDLQAWIKGFGSDKEKIKQIQWGLKEAYQRAKDEGWVDFNYLIQPEVGYWQNYLSVSYALDSYFGPGSDGPLLFSICFDLNTGERVNLVEKLPDNIDFSKAYWTRIPVRQTAIGQTGGDRMEAGSMPESGSVVSNAIIWGYFMVIFATEPDGTELEYIFMPGDFG